jgi:SAM-dependent methyltransferase
MATTADREREFYNNVYARHLTRPDHELAIDRHIMMAALDNPAETIWERRRLYLKVWAELLAAPLTGAHVLDYGCGPSDWGVLLATEGARVTLLDLSDAAIELGLRRAAASGVADRVTGEVRDASNLSCFADNEFDLVFGSASVHHTLKYGNAFQELVRVIKPGGRLVLAETLGNNPVLNGARRLRAWAARESEDQGEEIIVSDREIALLESAFSEVIVTPLNLLAMAKRLFRGRFKRRWVRKTIRTLENSDDRLLRWFPSLNRYCGEASIVAVK